MPSIEEIEYKLRKATDEVSGLSHALVAVHGEEMDRMDQTDCELRNMVINLHTEIQDLKVRLAEKDELILAQRTLLEDKKLHRSIRDRDRLIDKINDVTKDYRSNLRCFKNMGEIESLINEWVAKPPSEEPKISEGDSVSIHVAFLELP